MKLSIETLLANVIRTQAEFEAAKNALFLAKLKQQRAEEVADQATIDQATIDYCMENGISWEDRNA